MEARFQRNFDSSGSGDSDSSLEYIDDLERALMANAAYSAPEKTWWTSNEPAQTVDLQNPTAKIAGMSEKTQQTHILESGTEAAYIIDTDKLVADSTSNHKVNGLPDKVVADFLAQTDTSLLEKLNLQT